MDKRQTIEYIKKEFDLTGASAKKLIVNILSYVEENEIDENKQYLMLCDLLSNIGLSDRELRKIHL